MYYIVSTNILATPNTRCTKIFEELLSVNTSSDGYLKSTSVSLTLIIFVFEDSNKNNPSVYSSTYVRVKLCLSPKKSFGNKSFKTVWTEVSNLHLRTTNPLDPNRKFIKTQSKRSL